MTDDLRILAGAIFGPDWVSPLGRAVGVSLRTAQRWASGEAPVPDRIWTAPGLIEAARRAAPELEERLRVVRNYLATRPECCDPRARIASRLAP